MSNTSPSNLFAPVSGHWYGLTMYPGYSDCPYHSPIRIESVETLGDGVLHLSFLNVGYAAGVQSFRKRLKTLRRTATRLVAEDIEMPDRTYVLTRLTRSWIERHFPSLPSETLIDPEGMPNDPALLSLADTAN
jgi:hypothetical protein